MRGTTREETDFTDDTGLSEEPTLSIPIKKTYAKDRHHRHHRHLGEESAYPSRSSGDGNRDDGMTVTMEAIVDRHAETPWVRGV